MNEVVRIGLVLIMALSALGAGTAAVGSADMIVASMVENGLTVEQARKQFWLIDSKGLVTTGRGDKLAEHKIPYARGEDYRATLLEVVKQVKPTVLLGLSMQGGAFTEEVIREMHKHTAHPIIFALSNPTIKSECTPEGRGAALPPMPIALANPF